MTLATTIARVDGADQHCLSRRLMLRGAAATAAAGVVTNVAAPSLAADQMKRSTFVLVHGAYAGSWIWRKVIPLLRDAGHEVYATTATGMGDRVHLADPSIDLDVYITDVVNMLEYEDLTNVTLVGWSFGGFIVTGVAEQVPERLARLVYLDASVPEDGQNNYGFLGYDDNGIGYEYQQGLAAGWPGFEVVYPGVEEWVRAMTKDPADADWLIAKFTPQPLAVSSQPIRITNPVAAALPHVFIYCTEDKGTAEADPLVRVAMRVRADPTWRYAEIAGNHLAPVNDPDATAEALLSVIAVSR